jgi:YXWGXW repeat-containing protein
LREDRRTPLRSSRCWACRLAGLALAERFPMRNAFKALAVCAVLLAPASTASAQVSIGISIGPPPPPLAVYVAPQPGPEFVWVDGYWYPQGSHYRWHAGYWTRPPYVGAYWVEPYHDGRRFVAGYWAGDRGRFEHDHHWDKDKHRDERRDHKDERRGGRR